MVPQSITDRVGTYLVYTGRFCEAQGCGLQLTSRNRDGRNLMCQHHGRERDRVRAGRRDRRPSHAGASTAQAGSADGLTIRNPDHVPAHRALIRWLVSPTDPEYIDRLHKVMVDHELQHRLKALMQPIHSPASTDATEKQS